MVRAASVALLTPSEETTFAFHFRYIMPGEWVDSNTVAVRLLERVIRAVRPNLKNTGSLILRVGQLVYTQDFDRPDWKDLSEALPIRELNQLQIEVLRAKAGQASWHQLIPPDRIFVVSVSGRIGRFKRSWLNRLHRYVPHPVLFCHQVDSRNTFQEWIYLRRSTVIGELHSTWRMELAFEAIEFEEELSKMLDRLALREVWSTASLHTALRLIEESKLPPAS